jgi:hypothetical protein
VAHSGTRRLASITYKIEASRDGGDRVRLYEAEITVSDDRTDPRVGIDIQQYADPEQFLRDAPGREAGTSPPETPSRHTDPVEAADLPRDVAELEARPEEVQDRIADQPELSVYVDDPAEVRRAVRENPGAETIRNGRETLEVVERRLLE